MIKMIYHRIFLTILFCFISLSALFCQSKTITILHTNDMHSSFVPHEAGWIRTDPKPLVGGFIELNYIIDSIRSVNENTLLLDGGDVMTGNPIAEMEYKDAIGGALFEMMNMIGYEAWTVGNHDLDISQDNLRKITKIAKFPTISANLVDSLGNHPFSNKDFVIINKNGLRIGIIGIMSNDLFRLANTNNLKGLKVLPSIETLQKIIDKIDNETDLLIALTHQGADDDSVLAENIQNLDVIIGSHSHTRLKTPKSVNGVLICQAGAYCENLGELELTVEHDKVTNYSGKLYSLWVRSQYPENELNKFVNNYKSLFDKEYGEIIGRAEIDMKRSRSGESSIGDLVSDAIREGTGADFAITNSSGIRKDILAGDIRKIDLFEVSPFRNYLCTFPILGKELRALAVRHVNSLSSGRSSLDLSGLECKWNRVNGELKIITLLVGGQEVIDDKMYKCGTIDYVINQADRYLEMLPTDIKKLNTLLFDALVAKVKKEKVLKGLLENRFQDIK